MASFLIPKTLGACADALYTLRQARLTAQKVVDEMVERETLLREHIIKTLPKSQAGGISGKLGRVMLGSKIVPKIEDWEMFYKYVKKTSNFALLQKRLADAAIQEIWEAKKAVPGVASFQIVTLSVTKV